MIKKTTGSQIAKSGYKNEQDICDIFNSWHKHDTAKQWLLDLNVDISNIEELSARRIHQEKTDIQVIIKIKGFSTPFNIQVKLVTIKKGYNQIDKRWVDDYKLLWDIPEIVATALKKFAGEIRPLVAFKTKDRRRYFLNELSEVEQQEVLQFFNKNKAKVLIDTLKGRGPLSASFVLVVEKSSSAYRTKFIPISKVIKILGEGGVYITPRGSLRIGRITLQRKGGDGGAETANMLQFKECPQDLM